MTYDVEEDVWVRPVPEEDIRGYCNKFAYTRLSVALRRNERIREHCERKGCEAILGCIDRVDMCDGTDAFRYRVYIPALEEEDDGDNMWITDLNIAKLESKKQLKLMVEV